MAVDMAMTSRLNSERLHAVAALGDAVTHGRHTAGELGDTAGLQDRLFELGGKGFERFMRREHVVVGRHDGDVGLDHAAQRLLVAGAGGGEPVRQVRAREPAAGGSAVAGCADLAQICGAGIGAAGGDAVGDLRQDRLDVVHGVAPSCQVRPSRSMRRVASVGPLVPAG